MRFFKTKYIEIISWFGFLSLLGFIYTQQGILQDKEALKYLGTAEEILRGNFDNATGRYLMYSGYILFLLPFKALNLDEFAILVQIILQIIAAYQIKKLLLRESQSAFASRLGFLLYMTAYPIHQWTLSFYTEGLFIPLSTLVLCATFGARSQLSAGFYLIFIRPTGIIFSGLRNLIDYLSFRWVYVAFPVFIVALLNVPLFPKDQLEGMLNQHIILVENSSTSDEVRNKETSKLYDVQVHLFEEKGVQGAVGTYAQRVLSLFNPCRSWFSGPHNFLVAFYFLLYPLCLFALFKKRTRLTRILAAVLLFHVGLIALTYDDFNARYFATLLPTIILLACLGLVELPQKVKRLFD